MNDDAPSRILIRYQQLIDIARDFSAIIDLDALLDRIVHASTEVCHAEQASILLFDEQKKELRFQAATNLQDLPGLFGLVVPSNSVAGWVAENRQPVILSDAHKDERFYRETEKITDYQTRSLIVVPLISRQKLIGVLEVLNKIEGDFTIYDQDTLMALASQAAIAIENASLFEQSDLMSELVHELRTPLASISTIAHLFQRPELPLEKKMEMAQTIIRETNRMNELATTFLDMARLEARKCAFQITEFPIDELIKECQSVILPRASENRVSFEVTSEPTLPLVNADRNKIKQVILNLFSNSVKYNRIGGKIFVRAFRKWENLCIEVEDTGQGIPERELPYLFGKFFRSNRTENTTAGTGLGLYISKRIIENHGGTIEVRSQQDVGTTFTVLLPFSKKTEGQ